MLTDSEVAGMYRRVKRRPEDGSLSAAIRVHAQACGLVAYVLGTHPDEVAGAVRMGRGTPGGESERGGRESQSTWGEPPAHGSRWNVIEQVREVIDPSARPYPTTREAGLVALEWLRETLDAAQALYERVQMDEALGVCLTTRTEALTLGDRLARAGAREDLRMTGKERP